MTDIFLCVRGGDGGKRVVAIFRQARQSGDRPAVTYMLDGRQWVVTNSGVVDVYRVLPLPTAPR